MHLCCRHYTERPSRGKCVLWEAEISGVTATLCEGLRWQELWCWGPGPGERSTTEPHCQACLSSSSFLPFLLSSFISVIAFKSQLLGVCVQSASKARSSACALPAPTDLRASTALAEAQNKCGREKGNKWEALYLRCTPAKG